MCICPSRQAKVRRDKTALQKGRKCLESKPEGEIASADVSCKCCVAPPFGMAFMAVAVSFVVAVIELPCIIRKCNAVYGIVAFVAVHVRCCRGRPHNGTATCQK